MLPSATTDHKTLLREALTKALPGEMAHRVLLPHGRGLYPAAGVNNIKQSSVLVLIFPENGQLHTCLIRRPTTMRHHGGQIAFPGGRSELSDKSLVQTALRESFEEIGIGESQIEIVGALTPLYVEVSNFMINPFVGWCESLPPFKPDNREVDELLIIPVDKFLSQTTEWRSVVTPRGNLNVPGFFIDPPFIWGATAMIISEFKEIYLSLKKR